VAAAVTRAGRVAHAHRVGLAAPGWAAAGMGRAGHRVAGQQMMGGAKAVRTPV